MRQLIAATATFLAIGLLSLVIWHQQVEINRLIMMAQLQARIDADMGAELDALEQPNEANEL